MAFTLNGAPVTFSIDEFERKVKEAGGWTFKWDNSSMSPIHTLLRQNAGGLAVCDALDAVKADKKTKYADAIKYVLYHYPGVIAAGAVHTVYNPLAGTYETFQNWMALREASSRLRAEATGLPSDVGDLIYGCDAARTLVPYQVPHPRLCDHFNNAVGIGTGTAFLAQWNGPGGLDITPAKVLQNVATSAARQRDLAPDAVHAYMDVLTGSRFSPEKVFELPTDKLKKDTHLSVAEMRAYDLGAKGAERQMWAHARFVKAVRRACKSGIAMMAASPEFRANQCRVFFILDMLGDLGNVAFKKPQPGKDAYVPITSSELTFCYRFWNHSKQPLRKVVRFFVDGAEVMAPWEGDWRRAGADDEEVYSNQEAWLRYGLYRKIVKGGAEKAFPMGAEHAEEA